MKFGTSGLRGLVTELQGRVSWLYAQAFAAFLLNSGYAKRGDPVLVGRDFRASSAGISATCIGALQQAGLSPIDCGTIPTPALALLGRSKHVGCLMVTGSHIPDDRNGIKFYRPDGEIDKDDEQSIANAAEKLECVESEVATAAAPCGRAEAEALFIERNMSLLSAGALRGLRIGVYQHSTVVRDLLVKVLHAYEADVVTLARSERFIPVDTEAVSNDTIKLLRGWARRHSLDAIVSADGDGDRPLVADETGEPLRGDLLGLIAGNYLNADAAITPITSNSGIEAVSNFEVGRTKVGSPFVVAGMKAAIVAGHQRVMGFEANGGTLTASQFQVPGGLLEPLPTRDSFLPILTALHLRAKRRTQLSTIVQSFELPVTIADKLESFSVESSAALMHYLCFSDENLATFFAPIARVAEKTDIDGLRIKLVDDRIVHIRPSGNAPEMRCYVEATSEREAKSLLQQALNLIIRWSDKNINI